MAGKAIATLDQLLDRDFESLQRGKDRGSRPRVEGTACVGSLAAVSIGLETVDSRIWLQPA